MSTDSRGVRALEALTRRVLRLRAPILLVVAGLSVGSAVLIPTLEFDVSIESFLDPDDPDLALVKEITGRFGTAVPLVLAYRDEALFTPSGLERLDRLTRKIEEGKFVSAVRSLTNANVVTGDDDTVSVDAIASPLPKTQTEALAIKERALKHDRLVGNLVSADGTVAAIVVTMVYVHGHDDDYAPEFVSAVRGAVEEEFGDRVEWHMAGLAIFYEQMIEYIKRDLVMLILLPLILILILLTFLMRSGPGVVLPLVVVSLSLVWTLGAMAAFGVTIGVGSILLPPLVLVIGCADGVHVINQCAEERLAHPTVAQRDVLVRAMGRVGLAVLLTSATTGAGFASLTVAKIRTIFQFGLFAAVAIGIAFVLSVTLLPVLIDMWGIPDPKKTLREKGAVSAALVRVGVFNRRRPGLTLLVWAVLSAVTMAGILHIRVETSFRDNFKASSPIVKSLDFVQAHLSGSDLLTLYITSGRDDGILAPNNLQYIYDLTQEVMRHDAIDQVDSILAVISDARHVLDPNTPPGLYVPKSAPEAAQLLLLLESGDDYLSPLVTDDREGARMAVRLDSVPTTTVAQIVKELRVREAQIRPAGARMQILGPVYLQQRLVHEVIDSQIESFGLAFVLIFVMMALSLRSLSLAAVSMIPNALPIGLMLGVMGWLDIPLNDVTIMTASVAIGIAVDDTIHYLVRFRLEQGAGFSRTEAMERTVHSVGRAIVITSFVLAAGFATSMLGSFKAPVYFGGLSVVTIIAALAADLSLLPVLLLKMPVGLVDARQPRGRPAVVAPPD